MRLSHDRWYSRQGQRNFQRRSHQATANHRKLLGLSLLLAMVIIAMQKLSDPDHYVPAFRAIGLTPPKGNGEPTATNASSPTLDPNPSSSRSPNDTSPRNDSSPVDLDQALSDARSRYGMTATSPGMAVDTQIWSYLLDLAKASTLEQLAQSQLSQAPASSESSTSRLQTSAPRGPTEPPADLLEWLQESETKLERWESSRSFDPLVAEAEASSTNSLPNVASLTDPIIRFTDRWRRWAEVMRRGETIGRSEMESEFYDAWRLAMDQKLLGSIRDGSPWRSDERLAFARTLTRSQALAGEFQTWAERSPGKEVPWVGRRVEVTVLSKQSSNWRGHLVRLQGETVTSAKRQTFDLPGWGTFEYDEYWIRPDDPSQQPVCIYALLPATGETQLPPQPTSDEQLEEPKLEEWTGIYLKRMAYPSQRGVEVAPVIIGLHRRVVSSREPEELIHPFESSLVEEHGQWIPPDRLEEDRRLLDQILKAPLTAIYEPWKLSETPSLLAIRPQDSLTSDIQRVLYQLPRIEGPLASVLDGTRIGPARRQTFHGWVTGVERLSPTNAIDGLPSLFRLKIAEETADEAQTEGTHHIAFVNRVPDEWLQTADLSQPVRLQGVALSVNRDGKSEVLWMADRPDWSWEWFYDAKQLLKDQADATLPPFVPSLHPDWIQLGERGFDLSYGSLIRRQRLKALATEENIPFYKLLSVAALLGGAPTPLSTEQPLTPFDCIQHDEAHALRSMDATVHVVRITRIGVEEEALRKVLRGHEYFTMDGLANLGSNTIKIQSADGRSSLDFQGEFPVTLVSRELPAWIDETTREDGVWYPRKTVRIEGIFYRLWSYSTSQTRAASAPSQTGGAPPESVESTSGRDSGSKLRQFGPLVMVTHWKSLPADGLPNGHRSMILELALAVGVAVIILVVGYSLRRR